MLRRRKLIQKITQRVELKNNKALKTQDNKQAKNGMPVQNTIEAKPLDSKLLQKYYVSFGAKSPQSEDKAILNEKLGNLKTNYTQEAKVFMNSATEIAKKHGHAVVEESHIEKAALESLGEYLDDLDSGARVARMNSSYQIPNFFASFMPASVFKDKDERAKMKPVIKSEIEKLDKKLSEMPKSASKVKPVLSEKLINGLSDITSEISVMQGADFVPVDDSNFLSAIMRTNQSEVNNNLKKIVFNLGDAVMSDSRKPEEKVHLSFYDDKAKNILKNLSLGKNMFILHDKGDEPIYLVDSLQHVLNNSSNKDEFKQINKDDTKITIFNNNTKQEFFVDKVKELAKDKSVNHIVVADQDHMMVNSAKLVPDESGALVQQMGLGEELYDLMKNQPKNVKMVIVESKNSYYAFMADPVFKKSFGDFGEIPFPSLTAEQAKKAFNEQPLLMSKIDVPFSKKAKDKAVEAAALLEGKYPEKAQAVMKKLASYYVDKSEISENDVKKYMEQAKDLFKITNEGSSVEVVYDTGKKLEDFLGKTATKKEAESIIRQIKKGALGVRGKVIFPQDDNVGGGKKFFAKVIASETKSPYVQLNALDFSSREVDIFGGDILSPENAMKKVFSIVRTQAESSPNKSAVVFIENFFELVYGDGFSPGYSKAMSQLTREMDVASKKGLNVLVLGSVENDYIASWCSKKELKFIDNVEVESPSRNINAREEILKSLIKKQNIKIAGQNEAEKEAVIKLMVETSEGFSFAHLKELVSKAKMVAFERNHKQIDRTDATEAYLQLTTGRPASAPIEEHEKRIVASHECGHALNQEIMWQVADRRKIPWHLPDKVNFVTLDPRGLFGGAMFPKYGGNSEHTFETRFAEIVCLFGGHSAEKKFYNIDGSWGITSDMEMATHATDVSIGYMGQGKHTGKMSIGGRILPFAPEEIQASAKDRKAALKDGCFASDYITKVCEGFNVEFTEKYHKLVGTGDCIIQGDTFRQELKDWIAKQSKEKKQEIEKMFDKLVDIMEASKNGEVYKSSVVKDTAKKAKNLFSRFI